ncbi:MAG TPA: hypothetical protein VHI93_00520, partial [Candidatus Thermoplasmatota archaeon]|nr:hypothetical protein [Candidatus Thermoplasmatota archaeon]
MRTVWLAAAACFLLLAGCVSPPSAAPAPPSAAAGRAADDVVVVAVIDSGFNPYHWDFLAQRMPQAGNGDPSDDLPLDQDPATWLPGHPGAAAFTSYGPLRLGLDGRNRTAVPQDLHDRDRAAWSEVEQSDPEGSINLRWVPGTKVVGFVNFENPQSDDGFSPDSHGVGTTSVSVGNVHGACPSCLLVFVNGLSDEAVTWVAQQDWIDVQTNSWGYSTLLFDKMW